MTKYIPPHQRKIFNADYLILFSVNHTLVDRKQQDKSNNNTKIRPGATELIQFLFQLGLRVGLYSNMNKDNLQKVAGIILQGRKTGIKLNQISMIPNLRITDNNNFYDLKQKTILIEKINEDCGTDYDLTNTVVIDWIVEEDQEIGVVIDAWYEENKNDLWMSHLKNIFSEFVALSALAGRPEKISTYIKQEIEKIKKEMI